ncbi:MAG TPA: UDP-N-acetylglucosamine 2-epimerase (non-hydrolyzing) [Terriglobia bacterium]|nr:UDP-N-acetylglucosamine 2-epimerase (non-hydrolyzing) [Terriglobia bacterium]
MKVLCIFGTRPEAIKMAPVVLELRKQLPIVTRICVTAQHREMLDQVLELFEIKPDYDLRVMRANQSLSYLTGRILQAVERVLEAERPDWVLVQGDTTTAMAASLAAFYQRVKIGHVEAGLRTRNKFHPFPEEINRRIGDVLADVCFAPTEGAAQNLRDEGVPRAWIHVTGNTVIDALLAARDRVQRRPPPLPEGLLDWLGARRMVLITGHRRESFGAPFEAICSALRDLAEQQPDVRLIYPVHLNPNVQRPARQILAGIPNLRLIRPLAYGAFVWMMQRAELILTDSGGVQEEAPSLGKPVLVMREITERPEGIAAGNAFLVGADRGRIVSEARRLLEDAGHYQTMASVNNPYGDGHAARRIVEALLS